MKLTGKAISVSKQLSGNSGKLLITFELDDREVPEITGERLSIEIKPYKEKRTLDANAYAWVLIGRLSEKLGRPKTEIYRHYVKEIGEYTAVCVREKAVNSLCKQWENNGLGWVTEVIPSRIAGCKTVLLHYGSSTYDTAQMSRLIDLLIEDAKDQGIETATPKQRALMIEEWSMKNGKF